MTNTLNEGKFTDDYLIKVVALYEELKKEMGVNNLKKSGDLLEKTKLALTRLSFLKDADPKELLLTSKLRD